jgi:hypothetical protein
MVFYPICINNFFVDETNHRNCLTINGMINYGEFQVTLKNKL